MHPNSRYHQTVPPTSTPPTRGHLIERDASYPCPSLNQAETPDSAVPPTENPPEIEKTPANQPSVRYEITHSTKIQIQNRR